MDGARGLFMLAKVKSIFYKNEPIKFDGDEMERNKQKVPVIIPPSQQQIEDQMREK